MRSPPVCGIRWRFRFGGALWTRSQNCRRRIWDIFKIHLLIAIQINWQIDANKFWNFIILYFEIPWFGNYEIHKMACFEIWKLQFDNLELWKVVLCLFETLKVKTMNVGNITFEKFKIEKGNITNEHIKNGRDLQ